MKCEIKKCRQDVFVTTIGADNKEIGLCNAHLHQFLNDPTIKDSINEAVVRAVEKIQSKDL